MSLGTEEETKAFMAICVETIQKQNPLDIRTPVFIFERLCSIIYPEENDIGEFFLTLEKDPQQEDFLQVRSYALSLKDFFIQTICIRSFFFLCREECWEILTVVWNLDSVRL